MKYVISVLSNDDVVLNTVVPPMRLTRNELAAVWGTLPSLPDGLASLHYTESGVLVQIAEGTYNQSESAIEPDLFAVLAAERNAVATAKNNRDAVLETPLYKFAIATVPASGNAIVRGHESLETLKAGRTVGWVAVGEVAYQMWFNDVPEAAGVAEADDEIEVDTVPGVYTLLLLDTGSLKSASVVVEVE